ncbi:MAG: hypothetical protein ACYS67_18850 [Planctomycetota bacterium]|jgi:hypothetical protein
MDIKQAENAIKVSCIAAFVASGLCFVAAAVNLAGEGQVPLNPGVKIPFSPLYQLIKGIVTAGLAYGIFRRILPCAVILPVSVVLHTIYGVAVSGKFVIIILPIVFVSLYVRGIVGILEVRKSDKQTKLAS